MATRYLQLDWKSSNLYEYSKQTQEGFETHTTDSGTSYRKYEKKGITGELLNAGVRDSKIGQQLTLAFKVSEDIVVVQFNLYDQKGQVDNTYPESVIAHLGNLKKGETYTIFPYNLSVEQQRKWDEENPDREVREKYYDRRAVSFKQDGVKVPTYLQYTEGDKLSIPRLVWKVKEVGGVKKNRPTATSVEAKDDFLIAELNRVTKGALAYESNNTESNTTSAPTSKQEPVSTTSMVEEDDNPLPF